MWFRKRKTDLSFAGDPMSPERVFCAVADIHGRADLLDRVLAQVDDLHPESDIVFVGDYVDRGMESRAVLERLMSLDADDSVTCLIGNHEEMMLDFLEHPELRGPYWLRHGGRETLLSFDLPVHKKIDWFELRDDLRAQLGATEDWLRQRPTYWRSGNVAVVHAGADPAQDFDAQSDENFIWGHPDFGRLPRQDGVWVIRGHRVHDAPVERLGTITIDTGAYRTDRLTAVVVEEGRLTYVQT